jgi:hypothetical protein
MQSQRLCWPSNEKLSRHFVPDMKECQVVTHALPPAKRELKLAKASVPQDDNAQPAAKQEELLCWILAL